MAVCTTNSALLGATGLVGRVRDALRLYDFLTISPEWLPFSSEAEAMLIQTLVAKTLRYIFPTTP